jgi:hypothetical protein
MAPAPRSRPRARSADDGTDDDVVLVDDDDDAEEEDGSEEEEEAEEAQEDAAKLDSVCDGVRACRCGAPCADGRAPPLRHPWQAALSPARPARAARAHARCGPPHPPPPRRSVRQRAVRQRDAAVRQL